MLPLFSVELGPPNTVRVALAFSDPALTLRLGVNDVRCCWDAIFFVIDRGADGGNMIASAGRGFSSTSMSRCRFNEVGVAAGTCADGSSWLTGRSGVRAAITLGVRWCDTGAAWRVGAGAAGAELIGFGSDEGGSTGMTRLRLVFSSTDLSVNCRVNFASFFSNLTLAL